MHRDRDNDRENDRWIGTVTDRNRQQGLSDGNRRIETERQGQ